MSEAILRAFCTAFNQRDLAALRDVLAEDATAQVIGAPMPVEEGRGAIAETSLPYLLEEEDLSATVATVEGAPGILMLTEKGTGPIDMAIVVTATDQAIQRLAYITGPHQPEQLRAVGRALGLETTADE